MKKYVKPEIEVVDFEIEDILTSSTGFLLFKGIASGSVKYSELTDDINWE